jgi:ubiquitin carboxyl-terminal hydrolase 6/32
VKSQKVVNFPFKNFDPTPYLASVPQETILRHRELLEEKRASALKNIRNHDCDDEIIEFDLENQIDLSFNEDQGNQLRSCDEISEHSNEESNSENLNASNRTSASNYLDKKKNVSNTYLQSTRKRLVSTSLTKTPVIDGEFVDFNGHKLKNSQDPFDIKYHLYAVVVSLLQISIHIIYKFFLLQSHSGMMNGGHYVSYASNLGGNWYCFNDSSCREIPQQPNIDPSSAYLLFYERQNLDYLPYLPKNEGKQPIFNGNINAECDDTENELKKMCVLS